MPRQFTKQMGYKVLDLLHAAHDHMGSAKVLFERSHQCFDSGGYLAHMAFELLLKAVLLQRCGGFPNSHKLKSLLRDVSRFGANLSIDGESMRVIETLDQFEKLRYPNPNEPIEVGDDDWEKILPLYEYILENSPKAIRKEYENIDYTSKGGRVLMEREKK